MSSVCSQGGCEEVLLKSAEREVCGGRGGEKEKQRRQSVRRKSRAVGKARQQAMMKDREAAKKV